MTTQLSRKLGAKPGVDLKPVVSRRSLREQIITAARLKEPEIGDDAMIATMEWGYWIGSIYVSKTEVDSANTAVSQSATSVESQKPSRQSGG